ncbi:type I polyketide synthase [Streptomyces sp. ISL-11]|uniref:type I polyketide synthase n=1 Tax=Streptomyces sp. ISL-11 TaxID=2819174 RepID=UPI001BE9F71D|nr:type I polyketide synthase [Streptomyces sp. ISL-11]MBT2386034.1 SDR family NAD(P)-dependent oxidoreductase [Streptomyces sp. ISL-11]
MDAYETKRAVAIVGASCRLPGGITDLDGLWQALWAGRDLITEVPPERFHATRFVDTSMPRPGKSCTGAGGFLTDIAGFDADYFGIAPKEAAQMDPQQRLLLEMAAEACDDAGIAPAALAGSDTTVHIGISDHSYGALQMLMTDSVNAYTMSGAASAIAANRLSHFLDLRGPSMAVDTACSSSLVALVQACRTLLDGTSRAALAGGVNLLLSPYHFVGFSQASMLSPSGRCRSFSADADGYVRAEGGGVVLLKRLADALADGDRVHAVAVDCATNSDGRTMGLALPSPEAQEALLRDLYARAGVHPDDLVYLEAHGTGTPVGDPAECRAVGRALGTRRTRRDLPIGSVKSNLGHLEPASGMAGLFKALLVLRHRAIPATLHATPPNPHIDFAALRLTPALEPGPVAVDGRSVAGVNSFGFGGANAHVILAPPPPLPPRSVPPPAPRPFVVTARSRTALDAAVRATADHLAEAGPDAFYDLAYTAGRRRGKHPHRAVVIADNAAEAAAGLTRLAERSPEEPDAPPEDRNGATAQAVGRGRVVFAFPGNGAQWPGMARDLLTGSPAFRKGVEAADAALAPHVGWSAVDLLTDPAEEDRLSATEIAQPLLFAVQVGLVEALRQQGIVPQAVVGHSVGEITAAHAAGALTLEDAARLVAARGRAQAATAGKGRMAVVALTPEEAARASAPFPDLEIACVNSERHVTVSGPADQLTRLAETLERDSGTSCADVGLDHAFHSGAMDPVEQPLKAALDWLRPGPAHLTMISTVTGGPVDGTALDADYWWRNVRRPVRFRSAVDHLVSEGYDVFVDVGPEPILCPHLRAAARNTSPVAVVPTLSRKEAGPVALRTAVARTIAAGATVDWSAHFPVPGRVSDLPAYPWQRQPHWNGGPEAWTGGAGNGLYDHPLLGERLPFAEPAWRGPVNPVLVPWLADHRVGGSVLMPATGYAEMALAAGGRLWNGPTEVDALDLNRALVIPWENPGTVHLQSTLSPDDGILTVTAGQGRGGTPGLHARGRVRPLLRRRPPAPDIDAVRERCGRRMDGEAHHRAMSALGLDYGPAFRPLHDVRVGQGETLAAYRHDLPSEEYVVHPALLDGALQAGLPLVTDLVADGRQGYLPSAFDAIRVWSTPAPRGFVHVRDRGRTQTELCWDITVTDEDGTVTAELEGCRLRRFDRAGTTPLTRLRLVMRAAPHRDVPADPAPLPAPATILAAARPHLRALREDWRRFRYDRVLHGLKDSLSQAVGRAIAGLLPDPARPFDVEDLLAAGVLPRHRRLLEQYIALAERHGALARTGGKARWTLDPAGFHVEERIRRMGREFPAFGADICLYGHVVDLGPMLTGETDVLEALSEEGGSERFEHFYDVSPMVRFHNRVLRALAREMAALWPAGRPLRVLEVGGGTGGTTAALLPVLPPDRTRYHFTDLSALFVARAEKRFAAHEFVTYGTLDLDADPCGQGLVPGAFDVVVAANALHTAKDLARAVRGTKRLLAPGGHLLAMEMHDHEALALLFGMLESFWAFTDHELRPDSLLLPARQWPGLLRDCGFTGVVRTGDRKRGDAPADMSVLLAAAPDGPVPDTPLPTPDGTRSWIVAGEAGDRTDLPDAVAAALETEGATVLRASGAGGDPRHWSELFEDRPAVTVVLVLDDAPEPLPADALLDLTTRRMTVLRALATAFEQLGDRRQPHLWLVTRPTGALPAPEQASHPHTAAVWGATRSLANEHPHVTVKRLSLERGDDAAADGRRVVRELLTPTEEDEIALTAGGRFVPRTVERTDAPQGTSHGTRVPAFSLEVRDPGMAYRLAWVENDIPAPGPGEVVVAVRAAALNYRDIMQAVGILPADPRHDQAATGAGMECAGLVTATGPGVTSVRPGDRVFALAPGAFASHVRTVEHAVGRLPKSMSFTEGATLPIAFLTVHYSLGHLARLAPGETVLVHGAAGGVGLAALQYARRRGARVIATAGNPFKRDLVRALGAEHVLDSRTLAFAEEARELTGGRGVDVVLNSLAGEAITRGLEALRPGGRFIELGKRDIHENKPLLLRPFANNIAFFGVDLTALLAEPELAGAQFAEVATAIRTGRCRPIIHSVHPAARVADAFALVQHSRHIGKAVVSFDTSDDPVTVERRRPAPRLDPRGTYLVTGGLGGFGAATARWLADRGARHLDLIGRRGERSPEAPALLAELAARGVTARTHAADVTDLAAVRRVVEDADTAGRPLRGVVHSAMHLDDAPLTELTDERLRAVLAPKLAGAAVLDAVTRDRSLDLFLVHSSIVSAIGNIAQAPYAGANLALEALIRRRRRDGLPGTAIIWGALGETGYAVRNDLIPLMSQAGLEPITLREAFGVADDALVADVPLTGAARLNWAVAHRLLPTVGAPRLFDLLPSLVEGGATTHEELLRALAGMTTDEALELIATSLAGMLADVLQLPAEQLDHHRRLDEYGMDSLMATELLVTLRQQYDIDIPPMELLRSNGTIADLARIIHLRLGLRNDSTGTAPADGPPQRTGKSK